LQSTEAREVLWKSSFRSTDAELARPFGISPEMGVEKGLSRPK
jgi:hypothetical protein